jgi:Uma2 family endonuclease
MTAVAKARMTVDEYLGWAEGRPGREVLSPSSQHIDTTGKLAGYFSVPSVSHYLIVDPDRPLIVHHARSGPDSIVTRIVRDGTILLDPPGLPLAIADI